MREHRGTAPKIFSYLELKPAIIPDNFILIIDTREQSPLFVGRLPKGLRIESATLKHGDYSIKGFEDKVCVERKEISDFLTYIGKDRNHTKSKLELMKPMFYKALIVEARDIFEIPGYSAIHPEVIRAFLLSAEVRYGLHILIHPDRKYIEKWVLDRLVKVYNILREV